MLAFGLSSMELRSVRVGRILRNGIVLVLDLHPVRLLRLCLLRQRRRAARARSLEELRRLVDLRHKLLELFIRDRVALIDVNLARRRNGDRAEHVRRRIQGHASNVGIA